MIRAFDTLVARVLLVSLLGITVFHVLSIWTYEHALERELGHANDAQLAERLLSIKRSVAAVGEAQRESLAHDLSGGPIQAHWNRAQGASSGGPGAEEWNRLAGVILAQATNLSPSDVVIGTESDPHLALLSLRLPDDSWLNVNLFASGKASTSTSGHLLSTSLMALSVALLSVLITTWLTRPLRHITEAVAKLSVDERRASIPEVGPQEIRRLAGSFNAMHERLLDLIVRRTRSLAAVSHDLRTPLTRLRLRLSDVEDDKLQRAMASDIDEMEQMIEATLSYLKGEQTTERARSIDLVALLETIVDDARDAGHDAELAAPQSFVITARYLALKRALSNLVSNALRYGTQVRVAVLPGAKVLTVTIDDNGPGIPQDKLDVVFEPFVRLEDSRNLETGGVGLGLTIARSSIELDGGTLALGNRTSGGLRATVTLPIAVGVSDWRHKVVPV
jgi:signal transduction histidine kinase